MRKPALELMEGKPEHEFRRGTKPLFKILKQQKEVFLDFKSLIKRVFWEKKASKKSLVFSKNGWICKILQRMPRLTPMWPP